MILGIPAIYCIVLVCLLWFVIASKGHWLFKTFFIPATLFTTFLLSNSINGLLGWPTPDALPSEFVIFAVHIDEPRNIYLWVKSDKYEQRFFTFHEINSVEPRGYKLPYSRNTHEKLAQMQGDGQIGPKGAKVGSKKGPNSQYKYGEMEDIDLYILPPPKYPPKVTND